ncbi:MAG: hypothetical protein LUE17_02535 [Planctomycetaceae bacterium]|nr:hypothetical protein [Planctomycetaceae bacterium]
MNHTKQPLLVQFGAGNIGRSLVGQLFAAAGWRVVFVDVSKTIIDALNARGRYDISVKEEPPKTIAVENVAGIHMDDTDAVTRALADADLAGTSVGAANLAGVCSHIAAALPRRDRPLSVMLCENLHGAAELASGYLREAIGNGTVPEVGFIEAAISKMVPATPPEVRAADPLAVWAEGYNTLYLDADGYVGGEPPRVGGVAWRRPFDAYVDRKLLLHNFPHAAAAYHGALRGKHSIWECMDDDRVAAEVRGCMHEVSSGLAVRHGETFTYDENRAWADDLLRRFHNRALGDPVFRVGRDLRRKLAPSDRCIGALRLMQETGLEYTHTARAIAAALCFDAVTLDPSPLPEDIEIMRAAAADGPEAVLTGVCGLDPRGDAPVIDCIAREYHLLRKGDKNG